jgi:peptide/nickel transport system substrate-binding protein
MSYFSLASFRPWDTIVIQSMKDSLWNPLKYDDRRRRADRQGASTRRAPSRTRCTSSSTTYMVDAGLERAVDAGRRTPTSTTKGIESRRSRSRRCRPSTTSSRTAE